MNKLYTIQVVAVALLTGVSGTLYAQENKNDPDLSRELTLEREYDPSVSDANKVNTLPAIKEPEVKKTAIDYAAYSIPTDPEKEINVLPSGKVMTDILSNKKRGYLNFGIGTYMNMNGDVGYHALSTAKDELNLFFSHRSTNGKLKYWDWDEKLKAKLNDNLGGINYKHHFDQATLKLNARYGYSSFNYYGANLSTVLVDEDLKQGNQQIRFNFGVASHDDIPFGYLFDIDYTNFSQKKGYSVNMDGLTENSIGAKLGLFASFGGNQLIGVEGKLNYFNYSLPDDANVDIDNYAELTLSPYYKIADDNWRLKLGANVMFTTGDDSHFFVSPNINAEAELAERTLLYLDATGDIRSNSAYDVSQINRYAGPYMRGNPSRTWLDGTLGLKSGIAPGFWFNIFAGYKITDDDLFFLQDYFSTWGNVSVPIAMNSKVFKAGIELKYSYQKYIDAYFKTVYNNWSVSSKVAEDYDELKAYGKPKLQIMTGLQVKPISPLSISLDYYLGSGREYEQEDLKNISELNLTGTYTINDTFGVYLKVNNLLNSKYDLLYGYPVQGISIMGGVNINF